MLPITIILLFIAKTSPKTHNSFRMQRGKLFMFHMSYPKSDFQEETLKERLQKTLCKLKRWTSNEEGSDKVVLHNEEMLVRLKSIDGHAMCNVLKHRQSFIDGTSNPITPSTSNFILGFVLPSAPTSIFMD